MGVTLTLCTYRGRKPQFCALSRSEGFWSASFVRCIHIHPPARNSFSIHFDPLDTISEIKFRCLIDPSVISLICHIAVWEELVDSCSELSRMWRDSFAVPRTVDNRPVSRNFDDDFLLNVERQAGHLRRMDSSSFVGISDDIGQGSNLRDEVVRRGDRVKQVNEDLLLLSQTPVDSALPTVRDLFADFSVNEDDQESPTFHHNPLVPQTPVQRPGTRKQGSFVALVMKATASHSESDPIPNKGKGNRDAATGENQPNSPLEHTDSSVSEVTSISATSSFATTDVQDRSLLDTKRRLTQILKKSLSFVSSSTGNHKPAW